MDIKLSGIDGIETSKRLRIKGFDNFIVITTNHQEYAQMGYGVRALDYLEKPITTKKLDACMNLLHLDKSHEYSFNNQIVSVPYKSIILFESKRNYVIIHTTANDFTPPAYKRSMANLAASLPETFIQVHRSFIVNILHISNGLGRTIHMKNTDQHQTISVSKKYAPNVLSAVKYL